MRTQISQLPIVLFNAKSFRIGLLIVTLTVAALYIWQVNRAATTGYAMRDLESSIYDLEVEQEQLELHVAQLQSVDSVSERVQMLGLTEVKTIQYLTGDGTVAINR